jgi:hypothetical protein
MDNINNKEKILTLNFGDKKGVNILKDKYDTIKDSIIKNLSQVESISSIELSKLVEDELKASFEGKIGWYYMAIKLDLEVKEVIERVANITPQTLKIKK